MQTQTISSKYHPIIGMEIHIELKTRSKMFCGCPADHFQKPPNTQTCPVCLGMPGYTPVPNLLAIEQTLRIGHSLNCQLATESKFDRKHYFYPDLPKGYQISQYDQPLCTHGLISTTYGDIPIARIHLEEDTAKLLHSHIGNEKVTLIDFNRSGVALVEIVTMPDIHSAKQAKEYAKKIQRLIRYLNVSDADMEKGSMRVEANISLSTKSNSKQLPKYKVEIKNINSFRFLEKAIDFEIDRQSTLMLHGINPTQETRGYNESKSVTYSLRLKEEAADYRYFPEPDIPPLIFSPEKINQIISNLPQLPDQIALEMNKLYKLRPDYIDILIDSRQRAIHAMSCFALAKKHHLNPHLVAKYLINKHISPTTPQNQIIDFLLQQSKQSSIDPLSLYLIINQVLSTNQHLVSKYQQGKKAVIGVLIKEVINSTPPQTDPKQISQILSEKLNP